MVFICIGLLGTIIGTVGLTISSVALAKVNKMNKKLVELGKKIDDKDKGTDVDKGENQLVPLSTVAVAVAVSPNTDEYGVIVLNEPTSCPIGYLCPRFGFSYRALLKGKDDSRMHKY
jgi:hypothetical protein